MLRSKVSTFLASPSPLSPFPLPGWCGYTSAPLQSPRLRQFPANCSLRRYLQTVKGYTMRGFLPSRSFRVASSLLFLIILVGFIFLPASDTRLRQSHCDNIRLGVRLDQIWNTSGAPVVSMENTGAIISPCFSSMFWIDEDGNKIVVILDNDTNVIARTFVPTDLSLQQRMERRLKRCLRALGLRWP